MTIHSPFGGDEVFASRDHQVNNDLDVPDDFGPTIIQSASDGSKPVKKKRESTLRKAPQAPKRFKSSYIIFFMAQQDIIKNELGPKASVSKYFFDRCKTLFSYPYDIIRDSSLRERPAISIIQTLDFNFETTFINHSFCDWVGWRSVQEVIREVEKTHTRRKSSVGRKSKTR